MIKCSLIISIPILFSILYLRNRFRTIANSVVKNIKRQADNINQWLYLQIIGIKGLCLTYQDLGILCN